MVVVGPLNGLVSGQEIWNNLTFETYKYYLEPILISPSIYVFQ